MKRWLALVLVAVAGFGAMSAIQRRMDAIRAPQFDDELLYLPNERLLDHFTAGMGSVVADLLWLQCLQYTGKHFRGDHEFTWLNHMCEMITRLDPYFVPAYRYGGVFLAMLKADDDACIRLLRKGMARNPDAWELPYEAAMTYLLNRPDRPDSPAQAAWYLALATQTGTAPPFVLEFAESLQRKHNLLDVERQMWEAMLKSDDQLLRDVAERKLILVELRAACENLDQAVARYAADHGAPPTKLADLVSAGLVKSEPRDPLGGRFFIDAGGRVRNTSVLDEQTERAQKILQGAIGSFKEKNGRWPASLGELSGSGVIAEMPPHPYPGQQWRYDPKTGKVE